MNRLQFRHIAEEDTMKAIDNLENKNSSGHDGISNKLLKSIRYYKCLLQTRSPYMNTRNNKK